MIRPRPLKLILENKDGKMNILLRNWKTADEKFRKIRVSHEYSQATRKLIKVMIAEAKTRDGKNPRALLTRFAAQRVTWKFRKRTRLAGQKYERNC